MASSERDIGAALNSGERSVFSGEFIRKIKECFVAASAEKDGSSEGRKKKPFDLHVPEDLPNEKRVESYIAAADKQASSSILSRIFNEFIIDDPSCEEAYNKCNTVDVNVCEVVREEILNVAPVLFDNMSDLTQAFKDALGDNYIKMLRACYKEREKIRIQESSPSSTSADNIIIEDPKDEVLENDPELKKKVVSSVMASIATLYSMAASKYSADNLERLSNEVVLSDEQLREIGKDAIENETLEIKRSPEYINAPPEDEEDIITQGIKGFIGKEKVALTKAYINNNATNIANVVGIYASQITVDTINQPAPDINNVVTEAELMYQDMVAAIKTSDEFGAELSTNIDELGKDGFDTQELQQLSTANKQLKTKFDELKTDFLTAIEDFKKVKILPNLQVLEKMKIEISEKFENAIKEVKLPRISKPTRTRWEKFLNSIGETLHIDKFKNYKSKSHKKILELQHKVDSTAIKNVETSVRFKEKINAMQSAAEITNTGAEKNDERNDTPTLTNLKQA